MFPSKCKCGTLAFHGISSPLIQLAGEPAEEVANTRRFRGRTTDAVFMGDVRKVAIATDRRDVHFVDVAIVGVFEDVHLFGTLCSTYYNLSDDSNLGGGSWSEMCDCCCQA